jgi:hypothetical protein
MPITRRRDEEDGFDENGVLRDGCRYRGPMYALDAIRLACCTSPLHQRRWPSRPILSCAPLTAVQYPRMSKPATARL